MLGARRCRSTALTSFRRWPSATPTSVARPPVGSGCSAPSQSRRPNLTTGPPTPRRGWSTPNRKSLIGCLASFRGSRSSSIPASSFKWLRMVRTSFQTQLSNLAPSDVNKLLDGSTYPGWKMNCTAYKNNLAGAILVLNLLSIYFSWSLFSLPPSPIFWFLSVKG